MITKSSLIDAFKKLANVANTNHDDFNSLDGQLGDGDLGITISKGIEEINNNLNKFEDDLAKNFMICAQSFTKASSSSFGTLVAISFMTIAKEVKGKNSIEINKFPKILDNVIKAVCTRGKSNIGDKTFVDTLHAISKTIENNNENYGKLIYESTLNALNDFKGKECKIGRARMFSEKSKELNDPGMYAIHKLSSIFVE